MAKTEVNLISQVNLFFLSVFLILVYCITICIDARLGTKQPFSTTRTPGLVLLWNLFYFFCQLFPLFVYYLFILKYSWFLLGPGTHKVLFVPSKSLFPQSCVNSGSSMVGIMTTSSKKAYAIPRSAAPRAWVQAYSRPLLIPKLTGDTQIQIIYTNVGKNPLEEME